MNIKPGNLAVTLTITAILLSCIPTNIKLAFSDNTGGEIDLYTQKEPHSGKGPNAPSDAFGLGEEVKIYALATYNDYPLQGFLVAFEVLGSENSVENITFCRVAPTNETGIALISFRIPYLNETTFGECTVIGNVKIGDIIFQDVVSFKVGWITEIVLIRTVNESYAEQAKFARKSFVGIELALQNIAMTERKTTLTITIYDSLNLSINSMEVKDFAVQPNGVLVYAYYFLSIPENATTGDAFVYACAYTASVKLGGVPYCPEVSKNFLIINRDIAIFSAEPSPTVVYEGEIVTINVGVKNKGDEFESFNVSAYCNETLIRVQPVSDLQPYSNVTISFIWNTTYVQEGFYQINAFASLVPYEFDVSDNNFTDGVVQVKAKPPPPIHDIAVLDVIPSSNSVYIGETLAINVTVKNEGNHVESFNVTVRYDSDVVGTLFVDCLAAGIQDTLVFHWDTSDVSEGNYTISAFAERVAGEEDTEDNSLEDGVVEVRVAPAAWFIPEWLWWIILPLLILVIILLIILLYRRKKRKEAREAFYSGWTAWYYGYDLRNKIYKT